MAGSFKLLYYNLQMEDDWWGEGRAIHGWVKGGYVEEKIMFWGNIEEAKNIFRRQGEGESFSKICPPPFPDALFLVLKLRVIRGICFTCPDTFPLFSDTF